jgi:hypothetical protein
MTAPRENVEGIEAIDQLANIAERAMHQAAKLLKDNQLLAEQLGIAAATLIASEEQVKILNTRIVTYSSTIRSQQEKVNELYEKVLRLQADAARYQKLRNCKSDRLPVTREGTLMGGEKLDNALDVMS